MATTNDEQKGELRILLYSWTDSDDVVNELSALLLPLLSKTAIEARKDELDNITFGAVSLYPGQMPVMVITKRIAELEAELNKLGEAS